MGTECQKDYCEEDKQLLDEAEEAARREQGQGLNEHFLAEYAKEMPAIEAANQVRSLELLNENFDNAREKTEEVLFQKGGQLTDLQQIAKDTWPTQQQLHEMVVSADRVGMSEDEVISAPLICATSGVKGVEELIYDMLWAIEHQRNIPYQHKDDTVFSKIVFVDTRPMGTTSPKAADFDPSTKTLFIYKGENGDFPSGKVIRDTILPHEVFHGNRDDFLKRLEDHQQEWVLVGLMEKKSPSKYVGLLGEAYNDGKISFQQYNEELAAEWYRRYTTGQCSEMTTAFFEKYFSE